MGSSPPPAGVFEVRAPVPFLSLPCIASGCLCLVLSLSLSLSLLKFRLNLNLNQVFMGANYCSSSSTLLADVVRLRASRWGYGPDTAWAGFPAERGWWTQGRVPPGDYPGADQHEVGRGRRKPKSAFLTVF